MTDQHVPEESEMQARYEAASGFEENMRLIVSFRDFLKAIRRSGCYIPVYRR